MSEPIHIAMVYQILTTPKVIGNRQAKGGRLIDTPSRSKLYIVLNLPDS
jgi:hypothetical protein